MVVTGFSQIDTHVPFGSHISWWLRYADCRNLETLIRLANQYERRYLAWEQVRKGRNPFLENGTGFEGYFVGVCSSPEEVFREIVKVGQTMLTNLVRLHRFEHQFQAKLMNSLVEEHFDFRVISEWSAEFGAELARLRCRVSRNPEAETFRIETYHIVDGLPHIAYMACDCLIKQRYLVVNHCPESASIVVSANQLNPLEQEAWFIVQTVGKFGHPLIREFMDLAK